MAPAGPARALLGPGPSEVEEVLPWDGPEMAAVLAGEAAGARWPGLRDADVVVALTRNVEVAEALRPPGGALLVQDPTPAPASGHASAWLARPLADLGLLAPNEVPELEFTDEERAAAEPCLRSLPSRFLALHTGSGSAAKNWPEARFAALASALSPQRPWLLVAGPAEAPALFAPRGAVVTRELPLRVLAAVLSRAALYVGNDSGVSHLAAAAGAPTLALFGPTDPEIWSPVGRSVHTLRSATGDPRDLDLDTVIEAATGLLPRPIG